MSNTSKRSRALVEIATLQSSKKPACHNIGTGASGFVQVHQNSQTSQQPVQRSLLPPPPAAALAALKARSQQRFSRPDVGRNAVTALGNPSNDDPLHPSQIPLASTIRTVHRTPEEPKPLVHKPPPVPAPPVHNPSQPSPWYNTQPAQQGQHQTDKGPTKPASKSRGKQVGWVKERQGASIGGIMEQVRLFEELKGKRQQLRSKVPCVGKSCLLAALSSYNCKMDDGGKDFKYYGHTFDRLMCPKEVRGQHRSGCCLCGELPTLGELFFEEAGADPWSKQKVCQSCMVAVLDKAVGPITNFMNNPDSDDGGSSDEDNGW